MIRLTMIFAQTELDRAANIRTDAVLTLVPEQNILDGADLRRYALTESCLTVIRAALSTDVMVSMEPRRSRAGGWRIIAATDGIDTANVAASLAMAIEMLLDEDITSVAILLAENYQFVDAAELIHAARSGVAAHPDCTKKNFTRDLTLCFISPSITLLYRLQHASTQALQPVQ